MGKKGKIGKQRKDKYYQLAKETGYRSRAAFKLIQLNRKFSFLESSKVLIDLCAAPGGWLQVAQKFMPVSSVIIGVDLVPIKPIHNVITLQEDITTPKCRTELKKNLKTWKADVVLHDGAPNVGKSWLHDAFGQNQLTLSALHLASEFLIKGGCFVTKVFRSKDYNALIWVLNKLFKKVFATKPLASRSESAEIFIVCQNFLAPNKIDPKFFDPTYVFAEIKENEQKITANELLKASTKAKKAKAEGYEDGKILLYNKLNASEFIDDSNYAQLLSKSNEIVLDTDFIKNHSATTNEIIECIKDIKVLGRKELILLINWRRTLRNEMKKMRNENLAKKEKMPDNKNENDDDEEEEEEGFTKKDIEEIDTFENEQLVKLKRAKKKVSKEKKKLKERMDLKMVLENDQLVQEEQDLFSLNKIKKKINIDLIKDVEPDMMDQENESEQDKDEQMNFNDDLDSDINNDNGDNENNELLTDLEESDDEADDKKAKWLFDRPTFKKSDESDDEDTLMILNSIKMYENDNKDNDNSSNKNIEKGKNNLIKDSSEFKTELDTDDDTDEEDENEKMNNEPKLILNKNELAIASELIKSRKRKRDLMNDAWNRYMHDDIDMVPSWFKKEEETYCRKPINIPVENSKPLKDNKSIQNKKALEAKARKKKRTLRRLERARIKAESLTEDPSMSNKEKAEYIRRIYKKASTKNDKQPKLVVAKRQFGNRRPPGVKGRYKIVDPRMKKDKRAKQGKEVSKNKKNKNNKNKNNKRKRQKV